MDGFDPNNGVVIMAALGMTWQRPTEDRYLLSRAELREIVAVA